jgi:hypothetical protein
VQLAPDLVGAIDLQVLVEHAPHLRATARHRAWRARQQRRVALRAACWRYADGAICKRCADRLDPAASTVLVDEGVHRL